MDPRPDCSSSKPGLCTSGRVFWSPGPLGREWAFQLNQWGGEKVEWSITKMRIENCNGRNPVVAGSAPNR